MMDDKGGDIKVTLWNEAVDKYSFMKKGEVYTMKGGSVKMKQKRYNNTSHSYEIHLDNNPLVQITEVDKAGFENVNEFQTKTFTKLDTVATMPLPTTVDLIVMVKSQQETREVKPKKDADTGKVVYARTLELVDATTYSLECTVWDEERSDESLVGRCIAIQRAYVKEYNNRCASTPSDKITVDPPVAETEALKQWWENGGNTGKVTALSDKSGVAEGTAVDAKEGTPRPITYDACPKTGRKLAGNYCQKCEKAYDAPEVRYILGGLVFEDASGFTWSSSVGNETGVKLLNTEAEEMKRLQYTSPEEFSTKINDALYQDLLQVKFRVRMEEYQGVQKPKVQVIQATPAKYVDCGKVALEQLKKLYAQCPPTAQAAVKELVAAWKKEKDSPTMIKGKAVFSPDWHEDMSRLMAETC
jgi:hypothetical protein